MKSLVVEDDFLIRKVFNKVLSAYGECDTAADGKEAVQSFWMAWQEKKPYDLICMDIMMPNMDGQEALEKIRKMEGEIGITGSNEVKVIMITALDDPKSVFQAYYKGGATSYLAKPVSPAMLLEEIKKFGLIIE